MRFLTILLLFASISTAAEPLPLSLQRAVDIALAPAGSAKVQLAAEAVKQAQARSAQARSALLPDLSASVAEQNQTRNLQAFGIQIDLPIPGFHFPTVVGPFNTFDARASIQQSVFDFSSIRRFQASKSAIAAARNESDQTSELVASQVARAYLASLKAQADLDAVNANISLAQAVLKLAENQKSAGTGTGIEITRAKVQLSNEQQRLLVVRNDLRRAHLQLLRAMGMAFDTEVQLTDRLAYLPVDPATEEKARELALATRPDLKAQQEREQNARLAASAARLERLPTVAAFADYGTIGTGIDHAIPTRTYGIAMRVPIFDGGRRDARRAESASLYRAEQTRSRDLQAQVELDVRLALDSLHSADEQVKVSTEGLQLSENEFAQAQRRYAAGVAVSLEVTDAQTRLERARDNRIAALFAYNLARIDLAQAMGAIRRALP
jgi:outer membrane protein